MERKGSLSSRLSRGRQAELPSTSMSLYRSSEMNDATVCSIVYLAHSAHDLLHDTHVWGFALNSLVASYTVICIHIWVGKDIQVHKTGFIRSKESSQ